MIDVRQPAAAEEVKACCAALYESDWARLLLGESFHPGGLDLTARLGELLGLSPEHHVLDVAAGRGASALFLAQRFGCRVTGVDYGSELVAEANAAAAAAALSSQVRFEQGDAERLPFPAENFDAIICECAFCTFPDKESAAAEFARVLKPGGMIGLSDLTRNGSLPPQLERLLAWVACIADARPAGEYVALLEQGGLTIETMERHDAALQQTVADVRGKLLGAELLLKLNKLALPGVDLAEVKVVARSATEAIRRKEIGYSLFVGRK